MIESQTLALSIIALESINWLPDDRYRTPDWLILLEAEALIAAFEGAQ